MNSNMKHTQNNKKQDGRFKKKNINHNPQVESAKAVYAEPKAKDHDPKDFLI
ncbi:CPC_1213 family protein [Clostridium sp.]|uniref:CPC_1213 family protein n=1 Tax=Clostridium sp. TaxID=1506 RepID=UPI0032173226